ncbi:MAG: TonB-dependent receptor domain-containing protein [Kiritimatiellia bacterium]
MCKSSSLTWRLGCLLVVPLLAAGGSATNIVVQVEATALLDVVAPPIERGSAPSFVAGIPGVSLRSQGYAAPQADLCIRGAPFSASGLLLAGLALHNPQTEHFQADLPVPYDVFGEPVLLTGLDQFRTSSGHPAGSVALSFAPLDAVRRLEVGGGAGDSFASLRLCHRDAMEDQRIIGEGVFAEAASVDQTDGRADNDLNRWSAGAQAQVRGNGNQFDLLGAYGWRAFGARGFYGASAATFGSEEQVAEALVTAAATIASGRPDDVPSHVSLGWQRSDDQYWLERTNHGLYANHTLSDTANLHGDTRQALGRDWDVDLRADAAEEWIDGRYAGTMASAGLGTFQRGRVSVAALPRYTVGEITVSAGGSLDVFSDDDAAWLPAAGIEWHPSDKRRVSLSYTEAVRQPSYTELNYNSPSSLGKAGLERQHTRTLELAWREKQSFAEGGLALFAEEGRNLVDWVRRVPAGRWTAMNLEQVRTYGLVADAAIPVTHAVDATVSYQALLKTCVTNLYASRYVLDYARQTIRAGVRARLTDNLALACWQACEFYADNPARSGSDVSLAANVELRWQVWPQEGVEIAVGASNPWNNTFETYPGQPSADRRCYASMKRTW